MMTRKHFKILAESLKKIEDMTQRNTMIDAWVDVCTQMNPRFDETKFREACE